MIRDLPLDLAEMEADQPLVVLGRVREVLATEQAFEQGKPAPARRAWFGVPALPASTRMRSAAGEQSFHFAINDKPDRTAAGFDRYATERLEALDQPLASEPSSGQDLRSAAAFDSYALDHGGEAGAPSPLLTTLDCDPDVRRRQWNTIEAHKLAKRQNHAAGPPRINIRFEAAPDLMLEVAHRFDCPADLRDVILTERDRVAAGRKLSKLQQQSGVPWVDLAAPAAMKMIAATPAFAPWADNDGSVRAARRKSPPPAKLSLGRGVQPTLSGEFEFAVGLDRAARHRIMEGLNRFVQRQLPVNPQAGAVVPFLSAEHAPDPLNHPDNRHCHFIIGKSAVEIDADGGLTITETTVPTLTAKTIIKRLRCEFAALTNEELAKVDADYRLSPEKLPVIGIDATPQTKLYRERTVLDRASVPTDDGMGNVIEGWRRKFQGAEDRHKEVVARLEARHRDIAADIARVADDQRRRQLEMQRTGVEREERRALLLRHAAAEITILCDMARSRSALTDQFASSYAAKAAKRKSGGYLASTWTRRAGEAASYLSDVHAELGDERAAIAERERRASTIEADTNMRLQAIATQLATERKRDTAAIAPARDRPTTHRAVKIIAEAPLHVSRWKNCVSA